MGEKPKPIFVATHPRACSTAFERVFMTQRNTLTSVHEPFGDAFYYGPERLSARYENDLKAREDSGFSQSTYQTILERFEREEASEVRVHSSQRAMPPIILVSRLLFHASSTSSRPIGKRLFIKDIAHYLVPPNRKPASTAPSLSRKKRGVGTSDLKVNGAVDGITQAPYPYNTDTESKNPTVLPMEILGKFHFTFLIRHPRSSIPSYYRCTIPPLDKVTGFYNFMPSEAGYDELRRVFDYLRSVGLVGPRIAGQAEINGHTRSDGAPRGVDICVIDADDLLDNPTGVIEAYCRSVGLDYDPGMLKWDTNEDQQQARDAFEKWSGFHDDAMDSRMLKPREHAHRPTQPPNRRTPPLLLFILYYYTNHFNVLFLLMALLIRADMYDGKMKKTKSVEEEDKDWAERYGEKGAKIIRETVEANLKDFEYLKQFAIKV
ncbi:MAG: hypothetical protein Q9184_002010 [Pyrenodesmia sp. 2 TL-2023]